MGSGYARDIDFFSDNSVYLSLYPDNRLKSSLARQETMFSLQFYKTKISTISPGKSAVYSFKKDLPNPLCSLVDVHRLSPLQSYAWGSCITKGYRQ